MPLLKRCSGRPDYLSDLPHGRTVLLLYDLFGSPLGVAALVAVIGLLITLVFRLHARSKQHQPPVVEPVQIIEERPAVSVVPDEPRATVAPEERKVVRTRSSFEVRLGRKANYKREKHSVHTKTRRRPRKR